MTCNVFGGTLSLTQLNQSINLWLIGLRIISDHIG